MLIYQKAMQNMEAQESLARREEALWPNTKQSYRERRHRELWKLAYPDDQKRTLTLDELKNLIESGKL
jgi:hypothetical protein